MADQDDKDGHKSLGDRLNSLNLNKKSKRPVAVAVQAQVDGATVPKITAAGRGKLAEQILRLAFDNGVRVREDSALAEMLAVIELDSPVPAEAFMAVAEILSYVYRANGMPNPFDAVLRDVMKEESEEIQ